MSDSLGRDGCGTYDISYELRLAFHLRVTLIVDASALVMVRLNYLGSNMTRIDIMLIDELIKSFFVDFTGYIDQIGTWLFTMSWFAFVV